MIYKYKKELAFEYENGFVLTSDVFRYGNILAHYELYKKILELPGDVVELGVFKGNSLIQFCSFRELLENEKSRKIIGFDMFGEFPKGNIEGDIKFREEWVKNTNNEYLTKEDLYKSLEHKGISNVELVQGDIIQTLAEYVKEHPEMRISMLHIDTDIYEPAKIGLELLYDRVVSGGVIVLDDYGTVEGETIAVDEFFKDKKCMIKKFPFSHKKPSYIIKP